LRTTKLHTTASYPWVSVQIHVPITANSQSHISILHKQTQYTTNMFHNKQWDILYKYSFYQLKMLQSLAN